MTHGGLPASREHHRSRGRADLDHRRHRGDAGAVARARPRWGRRRSPPATTRSPIAAADAAGPAWRHLDRVPLPRGDRAKPVRGSRSASIAFPFTMPATNGTPHYVAAVAVSDTGGPGVWSTSATATPAAGASVPAKMARPHADPRRWHAAVDLAEGTNNGGSAITREDVRTRRRYAPGPWTTLTGVTEPVRISGLD